MSHELNESCPILAGIFFMKISIQIHKYMYQCITSPVVSYVSHMYSCICDIYVLYMLHIDTICEYMQQCIQTTRCLHLWITPKYSLFYRALLQKRYSKACCCIYSHIPSLDASHVSHMYLCICDIYILYMLQTYIHRLYMKTCINVYHH